MFDELEKTFSTKVEDRVKETGEGYMEAVNLFPSLPKLKTA